MSQENPIPKRLKEAREKAGLTQKELGIRVGMDLGSASGRMNHYEKGRHTPDIQTLKRLAEKLGVPINYFFCENDLAATLACLIDKLPEEEKLKLIEQLSKATNQPT
ncbi:helix-turn-helix transcriptional regulator [Motilimonas sp. 1_MG-2023]|uniref:helix-turn-helix domain-containing protein n=1 Tax=Motilimonas sp. 1_MG-2023 TaxID=3062672 RepID=UPI0026E4736D|nr:helix-turn-helix transcriptional regulator [Motilimonas sp. 1_MG-2023]MDO6524730.1 helix-turn-helix transcriptional regulator [Motilimonas sp. 1_MG-2023]